MRFIVAIFLTALIQWLLRDDFTGYIQIAFLIGVLLAFTMDFLELLKMLNKNNDDKQ